MTNVQPAPLKTAVSERALIKRINRKLVKEQEQLRVNRGDRWLTDLGNYYIVDFNTNFVTSSHFDLEKLGREMGCLSSWENLSESEYALASSQRHKPSEHEKITTQKQQV